MARADDCTAFTGQGGTAIQWKMGTSDISEVTSRLRQWLDEQDPRHRPRSHGERRPGGQLTGLAGERAPRVRTCPAAGLAAAVGSHRRSLSPPQATTRQARRLFAAPHRIASPGTRLPTAGPSPPWTRTPGYARSAPPDLAVSGRMASASGAAQHRIGPAQTPPASRPLDVYPSQASCRRSRA